MSITPSSSEYRAHFGHLLLLIVLSMFLSVLLVLSFPNTEVLTFQSYPPQRERQQVGNAIKRDEGGKRQNGAVEIIFPSGFIQDDWVDVYLDVIHPPMFIETEKLIPGTQCALGLFPPKDLLQPIELRVTLDSPKAAQAAEGRLMIMVYDYDAHRWEELASGYHAGTFQMRASVQSLKPIPDKYKGGWGGRTFLGVFERMPTLLPKTESTQVPTPTQATANTPTREPTHTPTLEPTQTPTPEPTHTPTLEPTQTLTLVPEVTQALVQIATPTPIPTYTSVSISIEDNKSDLPSVSGLSLLPLMVAVVIGALLTIIVLLAVLLARSRRDR